MSRCLVVIDGERCTWPPHSGNVHDIKGVERSVPRTTCPAGCDHSRGRLGICADHAIPASHNRTTCTCPADDVALVLRWVAETPLPTVCDSIATQVPRYIVEAARRALE